MDEQTWLRRVRAGDFTAIPQPFTWGGSAGFAHLLNGYEEAGSFEECSATAQRAEARFQATGQWLGTPLDLWITLFFQHRACRHSGWDLQGERLVHYDALCATLRRELQSISEEEREILLKHLSAHLEEGGGASKSGVARGRQSKLYKLLGADRKLYLSESPGTLGGYRPDRIYGRLDCPSALRALAQGQYKRHRVFFADEVTAIAAGFRPCAKCLPDQYQLWKNRPREWLTKALGLPTSSNEIGGGE
jgi:hypothetical protein